MGEAPRPKSPPRYPDLCGRRRLQLEVQILNREVGFLECQRICRCKDRPTCTNKQKEAQILQFLSMDQIKIVHLLSMLVLLVSVLAKPEETKLLQLFLLLLLRHVVLYTELQLPKDHFVLQIPLQLLQPRLLHLQPSQLRLRLQATLQHRLRPLPTTMQQLLFQRLLLLQH